MIMGDGKGNRDRSDCMGYGGWSGSNGDDYWEL